MLCTRLKREKMATDKIKTEITCQSLGPFKNLNKEIKSNSLKMSVFSNNGNGKTFLSRVFRLTENHSDKLIDKNGKITTDKLISFGANSNSFSFKITDKNNIVVEDFAININRGGVPIIPNTQYIYHTFNEDYVEENIQILSYEKDSNIEGFILGKVNIDVSKEENELKKKEEKQNIEIETVEDQIKKYLRNKIDSIQYIRRLNEYKNITYLNIFNNIESPISGVSKSYQELLNDYNKIKSVPENFNDINEVIEIGFEDDYLNELLEGLARKYDLSTLAEEFKNKIKSKQIFVESGLDLLRDGDTCPFCEQKLESEAVTLIDRYNEYLRDEEAKTINKFSSHYIRPQKLDQRIRWII
jgi:hypothetical protein